MTYAGHDGSRGFQRVLTGHVCQKAICDKIGRSLVLSSINLTVRGLGKKQENKDGRYADPNIASPLKSDGANGADGNG